MERPLVLLHLLLNADTRRRDHLLHQGRLLCALRVQYGALMPRGSGLQAQASHLELHSLSLLQILRFLLICHRSLLSDARCSQHRPMLTTSSIEGNSDCRARPFHSKLYFDQEVMQQQPELRDSYDILQRYHLEYLMTPCEFFYPRVALDFYQSMTTRGVPSPITIHFTIDGHHGILKAIYIVEAL